jgi:hypothetical protein
MGWFLGYDSNWKRDIGYGVPAVCDHPRCNTKIDRSLSYVCGNQEPYGGEEGCGLYFCHAHGGGSLCARCNVDAAPFEPKPETFEWMQFKLTDDSWAEWRHENPLKVHLYRERLKQGR